MRTHPHNPWLIVCALAAFLAGALPAFAQAPATQQPPPPPPRTGSGPHEGFGIQLAGGPMFANLAESQGLNTSNKTGWLVGLALGGNRGGVFGVEADVLYGQKGAKVNNGDFDQHIVDVPVMLKINIGSSSVNGLSVFVSGGNYFDWQFDRKLNKVDVTGDTSGFEFGWVVGGGVEVLRFSVQGRFIRGLSQINKNFDILTAQNVKTQAFLVLFAFRLN